MPYYLPCSAGDGRGPPVCTAQTWTVGEAVNPRTSLKGRSRRRTSTTPRGCGSCGEFVCHLVGGEFEFLARRTEATGRLRTRCSSCCASEPFGHPRRPLVPGGTEAGICCSCRTFLLLWDKRVDRLHPDGDFGTQPTTRVALTFVFLSWVSFLAGSHHRGEFKGRPSTMEVRQSAQSANTVWRESDQFSHLCF